MGGLSYIGLNSASCVGPSCNASQVKAESKVVKVADTTAKNKDARMLFFETCLLFSIGGQAQSILHSPR